MMKNGDMPAMPIEINGFGQYAPEVYGGLTSVKCSPCTLCRHGFSTTEALVITLLAKKVQRYLLLSAQTHFLLNWRKQNE